MNLSEFKTYCEDELLNPTTAKTYFYVLNKLQSWILEQKAAFTLEDVRRFLKYKKNSISPRTGKKFASASLNKYIIAIKKYGKFAGLEWTEELSKVKEHYGSYPVPTRSEIEKVINSFEEGSKFFVYFSVLAYTGGRSKEVSCLTVDDIEDRFVIFKDTKDGSTRRAAMPPRVSEMLAHYVESIETRLVFPSNRNKPYTNAGINKVLRKALKNAGIKRHITAHRFRHSYIGRQARKKVDLVFLQGQVGHKKIETTAGYIHPTEEDLKELSIHDPFMSADLKADERVSKITDFVLGMRLDKVSGIDFSKILEGLAKLNEAVT